MASASTQGLLEVIWACHLSIRRTGGDVGTAVTIELRREPVTAWATQLHSWAKGKNERKC